MNEIFLINFV